MPWTSGQRLQGGKYVIGKVLGQGGFGITYKALHVELNRQVVIKTPIDTLSRDPEYDKYIERFIQEGQILVRLSEDPHPHIVGVIDKFQEGSTHCLVMDFVLGENLFEAVKRRGALPEAEIVPCIRQIGEALGENFTINKSLNSQKPMLLVQRRAIAIELLSDRLFHHHLTINYPANPTNAARVIPHFDKLLAKYLIQVPKA
jgi:serine/threonine protein kinase